MEKKGFIYVYEALTGPRIGYKYVGQTKNKPTYRNSDHIHSLERKDHHSPTLQNYYNKYGKTSLSFFVLMECPIEQLNYWETFWIKTFNSKKYGFNCTDGGDNPPIHYKKCKLINAITGDIVECDSILEFSKKYNLCKVGIAEVIKGNQNRVKDWYNPDGKWKPKVYTIISPDNKKYEVLDYKIKNFCKEHKLDSLYFRAMLRGQRESTENGWKRPDSIDLGTSGIKKDYKLVSPEGNLVMGNNLSELCRKFKLELPSISNVLNDKKPMYMGWRKYKEGMELVPLKVSRNGRIIKS